MVGGQAAGASVEVGEKGCSVPICSWLIID